jgi:primosomal protein N''
MQNLDDILTRSEEAVATVNMNKKFVAFLFERLEAKLQALENAGSDVEINDIAVDILRYFEELDEVLYELIDVKKDTMTTKFVKFLFDMMKDKYEAIELAEDHKDISSVVADINVYMLKLKEVGSELVK